MKQKVKWSDPSCKGQQDAIILKVMLLALCTEVAGPRQIYANTTWKKFLEGKVFVPNVFWFSLA